jgi:hypothetical protein
MKPPYKSPNNLWYTAALFWDRVVDLPLSSRSIDPIFTLTEDKEGYINARKTFVALNDPTGYKWAMKYLGDYNHWHQLMKCKWFKEAYEDWMSELNAKMSDGALDSIQAIAKESDNEALRFQAAKYLLEKPWDKRKGAGRPSKQEIDANLKQETRRKSEEDNDLARIGLVINNGNGGTKTGTS